MPTREQLTHARLIALVQMISDDGVTAAGETPPPEYLDALIHATDEGKAREVHRRHRGGRGQPSWAGGSGGPPGQTNGNGGGN